MIAVAALSARLICECAAADGMRTIAFDLFGDRDTCRAAEQWIGIGQPQHLAIDGDRLLAALEGLARRGDVAGWIAGGGVDSDPALLPAAAERLPLIGTGAHDLQRLRDAAEFFACLDRHGIAHPEVVFVKPAHRAGWLRKNAAGCGGWRVHAADAPGDVVPGDYWQRRRAGVPMSATFVANGSDVAVLGFNLQTTRVLGERPYVFCGVQGPVAVTDAVRHTITAALQVVCRAFRLRGLGSIDFLLGDEGAEVIEVNARPPASMALYPRVGEHGPLRAHWLACVNGTLPPAAQPAMEVAGTEVIFAARTFALGAAADTLAAMPDVHDLPRAGTAFEVDDPVCSVSARGADLAAVRAGLARQRERVQPLMGEPA